MYEVEAILDKKLDPKTSNYLTIQINSCILCNGQDMIFLKLLGNPINI